MIFTLLFSIVLILIMAYILSNRDIFAPSVILCIAYIISILSACVNIKSWGINIHVNTFFVIFVGIVLFVVVNIVSICIGKRIFFINKVKKTVLIDYITIQKFKTLFVCFFQIITALLYYKTVRNIANNVGGFSNFSQMMNLYRMSASYGFEQSVPTTINQMTKLSYVCSMVYLYVFINNIILLKDQHAKERKSNLVNVFPVIIYSVQALLTGGRFDLLKISCTGAIIFYVLYHRKNGWNNKAGIKFLIKGIIGLMIIFCGFYMLKSVVGRTSNDDFITYITSYTGGSIQLLDMYLQNPIDKSNIFGKETFYALNMSLEKIGVLNFKPYIMHLEFRSSNGIVIGNVYTAFRRYIQDFGMLGMLIMQTILASFYGLYYSYVKYKSSHKKFDYALMVYALIAYPIFLHSINDEFFSGIISINYIIILVLVKICSILIIDKKIILK